MAFVVKDRVKQSTTTTGTGSIVLNGTVSGFQTFTNALSDGDTTYYAIFEVSTNEWEVGVGTWTESTTTLARTTVLASSNSNNAVNLTAQAEVFITQPAGKAAFFDPSGDLTLVQDPTSNLQAATKQYVDTIAAAGLHYHDPVRVEQEGNLSATYSNGTAGVGATLTNNSTQAALTIDGVALSLNDRVLIYEQTNGYENGIYTVTNVGSASTNWVLTRATDADSYAPSDPDSLGQGDAFFVLEGTAGAGELYVMNTSGTITFGTTNITFTQVASTAVYSAGTGLTLTGTQFAADGANITNVDAVTLDGIDSSQFLRSDTVDTKTAGNLNFSDNVKAQFGDSSDLQIYHDGGHSYISDQGTGNLHIIASNETYIANAGNSEYIARFITDGAVELYYDAVKKFETTSTGIDVTGTVNVPFKSVSTYTVSGINGGAVDTNGGDIVTGRIFFTGSSDSGTELFGFNNESTGLTLYNYVDGHYALYVANSNNIGLGTSTPGGKLEVNSNSSFPIIRARYNSSYYTDYNSNGITYNGSGQTFNFIDNGSTKVTIASGGNVGIGITSPTAALHVAKSSGNTIINLQRTNANTTGSVGTIQFSASDDHAVASIAAFGDGDDEGAYLSFRTTSSATTNSWYTGTDEAMRIDSNRDIRFYNDSGNVNLFWDASTMALGIGTGTTTPTNPITIQQTSVHWPYIALTNSSGVTKSQFGYQVNDDLLDIVANSGGIKFRTAGSERMRITSTGLVGINETAPQSGLHVKGSGSSSWITVENTLAGNYSLVDFLNNSGTRVGYIGTYNNDNALYFYGAQAGPIQFFTNNSEAMRITSSGNVGIGTTSPNTALEVKRTSGTATIRVHADHVATPRAAIEFMRGTTDTFGGDAYTDWKLGQVGSTQADFAIISHDTTRGANERLTLEYDTGNVGIGITTPDEKLDVNGDTRIRGSGSTMAGATMANASLLIGSTTSGMGIDSNEIMTAGDDLHIGGLTGGVRFRVGSTQHGIMDSSGNFGFGTTSPAQKVHVQGGQVRVSNGSDFYINSTSSNSYVYTSSTPFDIYTAGTMRMRVGSTGDVSIGNNAAFTIGGSAKLTVLGASGTVYLAGGSASGDQFYLRKNGSVTGMYEWQTYYSGLNQGTIQIQPYGGSVTIGGSNATTTKRLEVFGDIGSTGLTVVPTTSSGGAYFGNASQTSYMNLIITSNSGNAQIWKSGTGYTSYGGASALNIYNSNANIAFFSNARSTADMNITNGNVSVAGTLSATTKSFVIDHPTKEGMKLRHGSLEGPEDGVYVRGRLTGKTVIELPDYWTSLVHEDSITVQLTAMGGKADLWVESIADNKVTVGCDTEVDCFYFVQATRKDVDAWEVEYVADS